MCVNKREASRKMQSVVKVDVFKYPMPAIQRGVKWREQAGWSGWR